MKKPLLKASIVVDSNGQGRDVRVDVVLFKITNKVYEWRIGGEFGDIVENFPLAESIEQAKRDFIATYPRNSTWRPLASWI